MEDFCQESKLNCQVYFSKIKQLKYACHTLVPQNKNETTVGTVKVVTDLITC